MHDAPRAGGRVVPPTVQGSRLCLFYAVVMQLQEAKGAVGGLVGLELPWLLGICGYTLEPEHHEVLVVEDMTADARFCAE